MRPRRNARRLMARLALPCALLTLAGCTQLAASRVAVDYYAISGTTSAALDKEIRAKGPKIDGGRHALAVARIRILPNVRYAPSSLGCTVSSAQVNVDAKVTLPRWTGRSGASRMLGKAWDDIDRYTRQHEAVHVAIAFRYARKMEARLARLSGSQSCTDLRGRADKIIARYLAEHDASQRRFDADEQARLAALRKSRRSRS